MLKSIIKWGIKKYATNERIKELVHGANAKLAAKEAGERTAEITGYCNDATKIISAYTSAYANDGKIDAGELVAVNNECDALIDKYLSDERIDGIVDSLFN